MTPAVPSVETEHGEYAHLAPLQRRYATLAPDDPERQRLREQLISGYLPVAEQIARRCRLANSMTDQATVQQLLMMTDEYQLRLDKISQRPPR